MIVKPNYIAPPYWTVDKMNDVINSRKVYIWGAGLHGRSFAIALLRNNITVEAFLDRNSANLPKSYKGIPIIAPDSLLQQYESNPSRDFAGENFVIAAAAPERLTQNDEILSACEKLNMVRNSDCFHVDHLVGTRPYIDIAEGCNLKCIACPRGDTLKPSRMRGHGVMSPELYEKIARKCIEDNPFIPFIQLFVFSEPFLNPKIADICEINNKLKVGTHISTNLNIARGLEGVIMAKPAVITVSCSGFGHKNYEQTHKGGKWDTFVSNLHQLVELRKKHNADTKISLTYHLNTLNIDEYSQIYTLCKKLGIQISALAHSLFPDYVLGLAEGKPVCEEALFSKSLMVYPLEKRLKIARSETSERCIAAPNVPVIHYDGSVFTCISYYDEESKLADSYLDISLEELIERKMNSQLCARCMAHSLHRYVWMELRPEFCEDIIKEKLGLPASL